MTSSGAKTHTWTQLWAIVAPFRHLFLWVLGLTVLLATLTPIRPYLIQYTIDVYLADGDVVMIGMMALWMFGLLLFQCVGQYFNLYYAAVLGQSVVHHLRRRLYGHVQGLRVRFFDKTPVGRLVTRCVSDTETLSNVFSQGLASILSELLQLVVILAFMLVLDWRLTLVSLSPLPLLIFCTYVFKEKIKVAFTKVRNAVSALNTFIQEHLSGMAIVQLFGQQAATFAQFRAINAQHRQANMASVLYYSIYFPLSQIIQAICIGILVWYGAGAVIQNHTTLGMLISFVMYVQLFFRPMHMIADRFNTLQMGMVSAQRISDLLRRNESAPDTGTLPSPTQGHVVFEKVWFSYTAPDNTSAQWILKDISFSVPQGACVALVGATGAGKTSTIHLLNRLYDAQRGVIRIDGRPISDYSLDALRAEIGFVLQDVFLFSASMRHNITLYDARISDDQIWEASQRIGANKLIQAVPGGLDHIIAERGASLSVGERQLLSFLRVMVFDPKIIVLDEATSSVDSQTERLVQQAMYQTLRGRTTLMVAHRLSTILHADNILVFDQGRIVEQGTHADLLAQQGTYSVLYDMQFKHQSKAAP